MAGSSPAMTSKDGDRFEWMTLQRIFDPGPRAMRCVRLTAWRIGVPMATWRGGGDRLLSGGALAGYQQRAHGNPLPHRLYRPGRVRAGHPVAAVLRGAIRRLAAANDHALRHLFADVDDHGAAL